MNSIRYYTLLHEKKYIEAYDFIDSNENNKDFIDQIFDIRTQCEHFCKSINDHNIRASRIIYDDNTGKDNQFLIDIIDENIEVILENCECIEDAKYFYEEYIQNYEFTHNEDEVENRKE